MNHILKVSAIWLLQSASLHMIHYVSKEENIGDMLLDYGEAWYELLPPGSWLFS